jgi:hypothetical protein
MKGKKKQRQWEIETQKKKQRVVTGQKGASRFLVSLFI